MPGDTNFKLHSPKNNLTETSSRVDDKMEIVSNATKNDDEEYTNDEGEIAWHVNSSFEKAAKEAKKDIEEKLNQLIDKSVEYKNETDVEKLKEAEVDVEQTKRNLEKAAEEVEKWADAIVKRVDENVAQIVEDGVSNEKILETEEPRPSSIDSGKDKTH